MSDESSNEFEDYLSEFDIIPKFDSEICPVCGIKLSDNISINKVPLIELQFENEAVAANAINLLEEKGIKSKQSSSGKERILIPEEKLAEVKSILKT